MAAAYAAVLSLMHLMKQVKMYHARHPIFNVEQLRQIESLQKKVCLLKDYLEGHSYENSKDLKDLQSQTADAIYAAEDIIESHVVDHIRPESTSHEAKSSVVFCEVLEKIIENMDSIKKKMVNNKGKSGLKDHLPQDLVPLVSFGPSPNEKDNLYVGFDDDLYKIMDKLTGQQSSLQIIPITGMGGIGKTTLAKIAYDHKSIVEKFDLRGWITISQVYNERDLLLGLLCEMGYRANKKERENYNYHELGLKLHQYLSRRRYLIVMDDMWSIEAWNTLKFFFPDYNNKSRIVVTTRLSKVAKDLCSSNFYKMNFLDEDKSWSLFCKKVFVQEGCPPELEEVGKKITKNCKGLPLSIVVIGGLLAKSNMRREYWECVAEDTSSTVNSEDDERCLKILSLSYNSLPIYLKPCFLYMGIFPEDHEIRISELIKLWVVEGFLKPHRAKCLEEVAKDYLNDLIDRNLIFISKSGCNGNIKYCRIHDLLKDLCLREAEKERFICVSNAHSSNILQALKDQCRIVIYQNMSNDKDDRRGLNTLQQSTSFIRSLTCFFKCDVSQWLHLRLLRVLLVSAGNYQESLFKLVNAKYLRVHASTCYFELPSSVYLLWNLQVLIIKGCALRSVAPSEIWDMPQLRLIMIDGVFIPDPPGGGTDGKSDILLENMQTLSHVNNFRCSDEVLKRAPNIKKLGIRYLDKPLGHLKEFSHYCINNLNRFHKLQSLQFALPLSKSWLTRSDLLQNLEFPNSLKKLNLRFCNLDWKDVTTKIGSLPNLEKLKLFDCFTGEEWEPVEGQFLRLKFLQIEYCRDLLYWTTDSSLVLILVNKLNSIPLEIGEIATLRLIQVDYCNDSLVTSAKKILEEQHNSGNEGFCLEVKSM